MKGFMTRKRFPLLFKVMLLLLITGCSASDQFYKGVVSDHFDGENFYNTGKFTRTTFGKILPVLLFEKRGRWIKIRDLEPGPPPVSSVDSSKLRLTFIGHSTTLIQTYGKNILTDPVWSDFISPVPFIGPRAHHEPGINFEDLPQIDAVIISHNHYDHLDIPTLVRIKNEFNSIFYVPIGNKYILEEEGITNVIELDWWESSKLSSSLEVFSVPAQHFSGRWIDDRNKSLWGGFVLSTTEGNIYFAGDTGYGDFINEISKKFQPVVLSLLPIGAYEPNDVIGPMHVRPDEAVKMHFDLKSRKSIAIHFGRFPQAWESMAAPIRDLKKARVESGLSKEDFSMMWPGEFTEILFE